MTKVQEMLDLADRIDATKRGWLPISGHVVNVTFNLNEADAISSALRLAAQADAPADVPQSSQEAREKEITRLATIEECALITEGFDAACNSPRMKLFEEAGLVIAVYKRDGEIGAAIRALADTRPDRK
jgi:hypothetical protein